METMKNQDLQALEQIGSILAGLGPDSYIAAALKRSFGILQPDRAASQRAPAPPDELQQVRWPEQVVREWETSAADQREALRHQLAEAEALVAALKAKLYDLLVERKEVV